MTQFEPAAYPYAAGYADQPVNLVTGWVCLTSW